MLTKEQNELLCRTGPGTQAGKLFRRYWHPVGLSSEIKAGGRPRQVKVMDEDLVLFRDDRGHPGLLGLHCSHRLTSLAYGRVEDGGIRCPFHGWLYDVQGRCLEQPAEPVPFTDKIRHPAYPCEELGGLIFAYMGPPEKKPLLPRYEALVREDGSTKVDYYEINSNYLQNLEGAVDTVHVHYLHTDNWSKVKHKLASMPKGRIEFVETDYGICQRSHNQDVTQGIITPGTHSYFFMPTGWLRIPRESLDEKGRIEMFQSWYVPTDDTHTMRFQVGFRAWGKEGKAQEWSAGSSRDSKGAFIQPGPENDYFRDYEGVDTISGIPLRIVGTSLKGYLAQDNMINETQGAIADRSQEHLGALDKVLAAMRIMYFLAIQDVQNGRDPKHIIRDPSKNEVVHIGVTEGPGPIGPIGS